MTQPAPAVSPYVPFYASLSPYVTVAEYLAAPTGVDTSQLIPGGTTQGNTTALQNLLAAASNYADSLCMQVLGATLDLQVGEYRVDRTGSIKVPLAYSPVIEVTGVQIGLRAGALQQLPDLSGLWFGRKVVTIPVPLISAPAGSVGAAYAAGGGVFAQVQYVNGYANTFLAAPVAAGAQTLTVGSPLGVFAGMPLTIFDDAGGTTEAVRVAASYVPGSSVVPLAAPVVSSHVLGIAVSALPRAIKQAVIALCSHLIKTRGAEAIAVSGLSGGPANVTAAEPGGSEEYELAVDLLHEFRRVA